MNDSNVGVEQEFNNSEYSQYCRDDKCAECNFRKLQHKLFALNRSYNRSIQLHHLDKAFFALYHSESAN